MIYAINERTKEHRVTTKAPDTPLGYFLSDADSWLVVEADADGWIPNTGNGCPLPSGTKYDAKLPSGCVVRNCEASGEADWYSVAAYRPIFNQQESEEVEAQMKTKITKDCYVNVEGWTEEEVQKAAEIFAEALDASLDNEDLEVRPEDDYQYLMVLGEEGDYEVFVGDSWTLSNEYRTVELTKEDIFEKASKEPASTFQSFKEFSTLFEGIDISFVNGSVLITHWPETDVVEYFVETEEELQEVMDAMKVLGKYRKNNEEGDCGL